jgi:general nucleoside transport system permease protein
MLSQSRLSASFLALLLALLIGTLLLAVAGFGPLDAYGSLFSGAFGSPARLGETLLNSVPLILTGLAVAVGFRAGLFNIGAEGQLLMGAVSAAWLMPQLSLPGWLGIPLVIAAGACAGALWAFLPGYLKAKRGSSEVITSLMMSYSAYFVTEWLIVHPLKAPGELPATVIIAEPSRLPRVGPVLHQLAIAFGLGPEAVPANYLGRLHWGLLIALMIAAVTAYFMWRTVPGFTLRILGHGLEAATYGGVPVSRTIILAMMLSGAIAGVAGVLQVLGVNYRMSSSLSAGFGFTGIAVALLGNASAAGVVLAALLFGVLQTGGQVMQRTAGTPASIVTIIQGLVIFFAALQLWLSRARLERWLSQWRGR